MSSFSKWFSKDNLQRLESQKTGQTVFSATDYCERGQKSMDAGNHVEAMEYFQAAIDADSHFEKAYLLLAEVYQKQGRTDKAKSTLYALLALDPDNKKLKNRQTLNHRLSQRHPHQMHPRQSKRQMPERFLLRLQSGFGFCCVLPCLFFQ